MNPPAWVSENEVLDILKKIPGLPNKEIRIGHRLTINKTLHNGSTVKHVNFRQAGVDAPVVVVFADIKAFARQQRLISPGTTGETVDKLVASTMDYWCRSFGVPLDYEVLESDAYLYMKVNVPGSVFDSRIEAEFGNMFTRSTWSPAV
tara:strand:- start:136 stop:579 length:444 start_codon:yes stop_codon:yes gene_type:complete